MEDIHLAGKIVDHSSPMGIYAKALLEDQTCIKHVGYILYICCIHVSLRISKMKAITLQQVSD